MGWDKRRHPRWPAPPNLGGSVDRRRSAGQGRRPTWRRPVSLLPGRPGTARSAYPVARRQGTPDRSGRPRLARMPALSRAPQGKQAQSGSVEGKWTLCLVGRGVLPLRRRGPGQLRIATPGAKLLSPAASSPTLAALVGTHCRPVWCSARHGVGFPRGATVRAVCAFGMPSAPAGTAPKPFGSRRVSHQLRLAPLDGTFAVCRLAPDAPLPGWVGGGPFVSTARTTEPTACWARSRTIRGERRP
jgi:hypothetical protein